MNTKLRYLAVLVAFSLALVSSITSFGQVVKGSISGLVTDPQGAVVTGAQVKATNVQTGIVSTTVTDSSGSFRLNLLPVGTYAVEISQQGFKTAVQNNVAVTAGQDRGLGTVKMSLGEKSTTIEVSANAPLIETTQAQITNTFSGTALTTFAGIQENEGLDRLALFVPGVVATRSDNFSNTNGGGFSSNGLRGRNNDQQIDGQNNNDNSVGGPGLFLSDVEFVQQYVLVTNNFGPEYGRNAGSVVNIITKSGTNAWHGSAFGYENNSYLNALTNTQKNTIQPGSISAAHPQGVPFTGPPRSNNEYSGVTLGGPVRRNKLFVFGGFDNQMVGANSVYTSSGLTPTPNGLAALNTCAAATPANFSATALSVLQNFGPYSFTFGNPTPRPTAAGGTAFATQTIGGCAVEVGGVTRIVAAPVHQYDVITRVDWQLANDTIMGRYIYNKATFFNLSDNGAAGWVFDEPALSQAILLSDTHTFSARMVNEARVSFGRLGVEFGGSSLNSFEPTAPNIAQAFTNIAIQGGGLSMGPATNLPQSRLVNTWQGQDNWNYVLGRHSIKAGVNWSYQRSPNVFLPIINGAFRFSSLTSFLTTDTPNRIQIANGNPNLDFREYDTFAYGGDDWKLGRNLTLNLGLTWTYYGSPSNLFNQLTTTRESDPNSAFWLQTLPLSERTNAKLSAVTNSLGPSVGFAWSPQWGGFLTGNGKTVIRGGYRMLYDPPFYNIFVNISSSAPMTFLQTITDAPTLAANPLLPTPTGPNVRTQLQPFLKLNTFDPRTNAETNISSDFGPDKVQSWSLGFEREVTKNAVVEVRYVGNHGYNLFQTVDGNPYVGRTAAPGQLQAGLIPAGTSSCAVTDQLGPGSGTDLGRLNCGLGVVRTRNNGGFSDYHALQAEFRANNLFKQLTLRTSYTFSKTLDNVSEIFATGTAGNTLFAAQNPFQTGGAERSLSGLNIPHAWSLSINEKLPFFSEQHGLIGKVLGGWEFSADYLVASGQGFTPLQNGEALSSPFGNVYDLAFVQSFVGFDTARPFFGSTSAPENAVGIYAGDACSSASLFAGLLASGKTAVCATGANTLVSVNSLNNNTVLPVTNDQVRFIINGRVAQQTFGTPFGNVPRNPLQDAISNIGNANVFKNIKLGERANFQLQLSANNVLNHYNFVSIDPNIENAGRGAFGADFANPRITAANGRVLFVGAKYTF